MSSLGNRYRSPSQSGPNASRVLPTRPARISAWAMCGRPTVPPPAPARMSGQLTSMPSARSRRDDPFSAIFPGGPHPGQLGDQFRVVRVEQVRQQVQRHRRLGAGPAAGQLRPPDQA